MNHSAGPGGSGQSGRNSAGAAPASGETPPAGADAPPEVATRIVKSGLAAKDVLDRLGRRSRAGKLAGYAALGRSEDGAERFRVTAFGGIYDYELIGRIGESDAGSRVTFEMRLLKKTPIIAAGLLVFMVFPGLQLTDSMLCSYFSWYRIETWWWYMPMVVLTVPVMWKQFTASRAEARRDAMETIGKIEREVGER